MMSKLGKALVAASVLGFGLFAVSRKASAADGADDEADDDVEADDDGPPRPAVWIDPQPDGPADDDVPPSSAPRPAVWIDPQPDGPLNPFGDLPPPPDPDPPSDDGPKIDLGPPWSALLATYPRGARFYQVVPDDRFGGTNGKSSIAYRFLMAEAYLAAKEFGGLSEEDALVWAGAAGKIDKLRGAIIEEIQCVGWNDALYGQKPKNGTHTSRHGRSILLQPMHGPIAQRLATGQQPFRNVTKSGGLGNPAFRRLECLWLMPIDREQLWEHEKIVTDSPALYWADGTSMQNPPPWVMALGVGDQSGDLQGDFGCPDTPGEVEVA